MEPTLYQYIHCRHGVPRQLGEHLDLLRAAASALFNLTPSLDERKVHEAIAQRIAAERYPASISLFVRIELSSTGELTLRSVEPSLYDGYTLRSLHPATTPLIYDHPCHIRWTTAAEAADRLAEEVARAHGADGALRCTADKIVLGWGAAPLFALRSRELHTSEEPQTVEARLFVRAAEQLGIKLHIHPLHTEELPRYDELLAVDHRGITAIGSCDGQPFIALKAERIAAEMERIVTAR